MSPRIGGGDRVGAIIVKVFGFERCCIGAEFRNWARDGYNCNCRGRLPLWRNCR